MCGLGAFVALLTLFPLHISVLFHIYLFAAFLRDISTLLSRHFLALLSVLSVTFLLGNLHTVLDIFTILLWDVFAALRVGGLTLLSGH